MIRISARIILQLCVLIVVASIVYDYCDLHFSNTIIMSSVIELAHYVKA